MEASKNAISKTHIFIDKLIMNHNCECDDEYSDKSTDFSEGAFSGGPYVVNNVTYRNKIINELNVSKADMSFFR